VQLRQGTYIGQNQDLDARRKITTKKEDQNPTTIRKYLSPITLFAVASFEKKRIQPRR
jgi:hypothetical protein